MSTPLPIEPSYGTGFEQDYAVERVQFGENYGQRSNLGPNSSRQKGRLVWDHLTDTEAETLRVFFEGLAGTALVNWTPQGQPAALNYSAKRFRCSARDFDDNQCTVELLQEFDNA